MTPRERWKQFVALYEAGDWAGIAAWQEQERQGILAFVVSVRDPERETE